MLSSAITKIWWRVIKEVSVMIFFVVVVGVLLQMPVYFIYLSSFLPWHSGKIDCFQQSCFQSSSLGWALNEHLSDKSQLLIFQIMFCLICSKANLARRKQSHQTWISQLPSGKLSVILSSQMSAFCNIGYHLKTVIRDHQKMSLALSLLSAHWLISLRLYLQMK